MTDPSPDDGKLAVSLRVNGREWAGKVRPEEVLLDFLRERLGLTGTKRSCEAQVCGACTVLIDGQAVSSCMLPVFEADGKPLTTIEGLASEDGLDPLQEAFMRRGAAQCGYCRSGMIMAAKALLLEDPHPSREKIAAYLNGNICRCGAYPAILAAVIEAASAES